VPDHNCPRAAGVRSGPTRPWSAHWCFFRGTALTGDLVVFWCAGCGRGVQALDRDRACRPLGRRGRAG
jgi:hypothetical protein